jgi:hypothetical protein
MHIKEYIFTNNTLKIVFDTTFSHIKLQKLEQTNDPIVLDYDEIEMSFSKPKNTITLFTNSDDAVIVVLEINKQSTKCSFHIKSQRNALNKPAYNIPVKVLLLKNENIFAQITARKHGIV